jgi:hypothetical protein
MPNPTFQAIVSAVNQSGAAFRSVRTDLSAVRREADATRGALVKLDRPGMLSSLSGSTRVLGEHFGALNTRVAATGGLLRSLFPALAGLGAVGSVAGLFGLVAHVADARGDFISLAESMGLTARQLQQFNYIARMSDMPIEAMQLGIGKLAKGMGAAALGKNNDVATILQRLGFSLADVRSGAVTVSDVMPKLAASFAKTENATLKAWVATTLFGKGGLAMVPALNQGAAAWKVYVDEARKLQYAFTPADNENLERYDRSMIRQREAAGAFTDQVASRLAPVLGPIVDEMGNWITANRGWIASDITGAIREFSGFLRQQDWSGAGRDLMALARGAGDLVSSFGGLKNVVEALILFKLGTWAFAAATGLFRVAAGIEAIALAIPGVATAAALVPAWVVALMRGLSIGGGVYLGFTIGKSSIATEEQEQAELKRLRNPATVVPTGAPPEVVTPPQMSGADLSRLIHSARVRPSTTPGGVPTFVAPETVTPPGSTMPILMPPNRIPPTGPLFGPQRLRPPSAAFPSLEGQRNGPLFAPDLRFPSPYAGSSGGALSAGTLDGRLRIQLDIPNLPEGARVTTETSGNAPEPEVNVGHSDPMAGF